MSDDSAPPRRPDAKRPDVEIFTPPHPLKSKVKGGGAPTAEMLARAEAAVAKMSDDYPAWAAEEVEALAAVVDGLEPGARRADDAVRQAFQMAHDMRGQGGSFGYPLMTRIANSCCRFLDRLETLDAGAVAILKTHINAMRAVIGNRVKGDGGPIGAKIADGLDAAVERYLGRRLDAEE